MSNVLVIGDTHAPCMLPQYVDFLVQTYDAWSCNKVVHIGDIVDNCALSFHLKKPHLKDPVAEYERAQQQVDLIVSAFPKADLMIGNHDALPYRLCEEIGIPEDMMRSPAEIWKLGKWNVHPRFDQLEIDGVIYQHGDCGKSSASLNARAEFKSVVQGHHHSKAGIEFHVNRNHRVFGMQVGCGVDYKHMAMDYGRKFNTKPILGCGIVLEGTTPIFEPMILI
jgi:predicted phosphodiesterase